MTFSHEHVLPNFRLFSRYHVHGRADLPTAQTLTTKDFKLNLPILAFLKHHPDQFVQMSLKHLKLAEH